MSYVYVIAVDNCVGIVSYSSGKFGTNDLILRVVLNINKIVIKNVSLFAEKTDFFLMNL